MKAFVEVSRTIRLSCVTVEEFCIDARTLVDAVDAQIECHCRICKRVFNGKTLAYDALALSARSFASTKGTSTRFAQKPNL